ncbi:hypothetical protein WH221_01475 [Chryseobacterium culicis]|uniref:Beta-lactamase-inhibitor-like, PepSY-like n=1 Tax=Chryseobacterium culicis TaxID=680127 RepID=A0A2S9CWV8_CHRCI|nr:hypothetical protein [Chryseobacterium culicis]PRB84951.1 hypothetical protein CQ022_01410 [Chryseobacterium culicis]PRB91325.1 hypothetical protein CQ033_11580 [Chryseobacterium culicis]
MQTKPFTFIATLFFLVVSVSVFSQKTATLNSLLDKNSEFIFPQTPDKISKALNVKTVFYEDANEEKYAKWPMKTGLELYCSLGKDNIVNEMFFTTSDNKPLVIEGLPFGLILNKSTLQDSKTKFSKYNAKAQKLGADSEFPGGSKLVFKKGKHYTTLLFDSKNLLKSLSLTTALIDPAAN